MSEESSEENTESLFDKVNDAFILRLRDVDNIDSQLVDAIDALLKSGEKNLVDSVRQLIEQEDMSDEDT